MSSDNTPSLSAFPYAGWIPTANGRLSFRHIGETRHPTPSIYANVASKTRRYVLAFQRRNLSDSAFRSVTDYLCDVSGDFWFAVTATSTAAPHDLQAAITGTVFIFKSKQDWREGPAEAVRSAIEDLNSLRLSLDNERDQKTDDAFVAARDALAEHVDITLKFELHRAGEIYFSDPTFKDSELAYASKSFATEAGHDFEKWIADQSYFFLRDIAHQHQHHAPHVDTILTLQKREADQLAWRRNILFSLHYYVISARRTRRPQNLIQALGVLAYCESFVGVCVSAGCKATDLPTFEEHAIGASIRAQLEEQDHAMRGKERRADRQFNLQLAMIAIIAPVLALIGVFVQPRIGTPENEARFPRLHATSTFLSDYFAEVLGTIVLVAVGISVLALLVPAIRNAKTGRDVLRIGLVNRGFAAFVFIAIGIGALGFGVFFGIDAIREMAEPFKVLWNGLRTLFTPAR